MVLVSNCFLYYNVEWSIRDRGIAGWIFGLRSNTAVYCREKELLFV